MGPRSDKDEPVHDPSQASWYRQVAEAFAGSPTAQAKLTLGSDSMTTDMVSYVRSSRTW